MSKLLDFITRRPADTPAMLDVVDELVRLPEVARQIGELETRDVAKRSALIERKRTAPTRHEAAVLRAAKRYVAASRAREDAEQNLTVKRAEEAEAMAANMGAAYGAQREITDIDKQLVETADRRVQQTIDALTHQRSNEVQKQLWVTHREGGGTVSNIDDCNAATAALVAAIERLREMQREALTSREVEEQITALLQGLRPTLSVIGMKPPRLIDGKLIPPAHPDVVDEAVTVKEAA